MGNYSDTKQIYSDEELMWLKFNYDYCFLKSKNEEVRSISRELVGKYKSVTRIISAFYPYQPPDGRPVMKRKGKGCRYQYWTPIRMTESGSFRVLKQCLLNYCESVNNMTSTNIEIHNNGDVVGL